MTFIETNTCTAFLRKLKNREAGSRDLQSFINTIAVFLFLLQKKFYTLRSLYIWHLISKYFGSGRCNKTCITNY